MFGALRLLLAFLVVISHLGGGEYAAHFGFYAVRGFFVLSGYIMTSALHEVYAFDGARFWLNRTLRLLPGYYLVLLLTLAAIALIPDAARFQPTWHPASQHHDVMMNVLVLPLQFNELDFRVLPPYWSIAVEIEMYFILWVVLARREAFAVIGFIAGVAYHAACLYAGLYWTMRYYPAPSAFLSFSLGALVYFALKRNKDLIGGKVAALAGAAWLINLAAAGWLLPETYVYGVGFYLDIVLSVIIVSGLAGRKGSPRFARFDRMMGELAYPVFLLQWVVGLLVFETIMPGTLRGWPLVLATMPALLAAAAVLAWAQHRYVEPLRSHLRTMPRSAIRQTLRALGTPAAPVTSPARD